MLKQIFKTAWAATLAVFYFSNPALASDQNNSDCMELFNQVQESYSKSNFEATVIESNPMALELYSLAHFDRSGISYSSWKSLNNEIAGYALRNNKGFDYNTNRSYIGPLSWHQSLVWDKLFSNKTKLVGYECTLIGRSRLAGRRVSVLRLNPIDEVRYGFMVAKDEDTSLPVELAITTPSKMVNARLTVSAVQATALDNLNFPDDTFDRSESLQPKPNTEKATIWSELTIPKFFKLIDHGKIEQQKGVFADYQKFSDGLVEFMVYRNSKTDLMIQSASDGTLTVFRKNSDKYEYAVVGEIPLELSSLVLSKIKHTN